MARQPDRGSSAGSVTLACLLAAACSPGPSDTTPLAGDAGANADARSSGDGDADTDADADTDSDADTDADADADSDTDADADADADADPLDPVDPEDDRDGDGLDDAFEAAAAETYLPFLSVSPDDACPESAIVYRARPHPDDPAKLHIVYVVLYDDDCGTGGHAGDDETFATAVDPTRPAPEGLLAMVAVPHQGSVVCRRVNRCVTCGDEERCTMAVVDDTDWPVVFVSRDKHAGYVQEDECDGGCFFLDQCDQAAAPARPPMVNAGEPEHPLVTDLTEAGLVTADNGFENEELMHYDAWGGEEFGTAGEVSDDLTDQDFDVPLPDCD